MSEPVNQINHAEVIREAIHNAYVNPSRILASLAAMQKELEEARAERDGSMDVARIAESKYEMEHADRDRLRIRAETTESTITAQAERIARLEEALEEASQTVASFEGLIGYGPDCDEKIARWEALTPPTP